MFVLEPMVGRIMLPFLGGAPAVWNTCVMFFQCMLLVGYGYAHAGTSVLGARRHALLHVLALAVSVVFVGNALIVPPPAGAAPPVGWLLSTLIVSIGLPFFLLAATAPLLQVWFSQTGHRDAGDPYFLYAASNLGSLAGLLLYPTLIEPVLPLSAQATYWRYGYVGFAAAITACAAVVWLSASRRQSDPLDGNVPEIESSIGRIRRLRWVALAFAPSSLMLAVTSFISTDVAAVPLLWVVPLALYLLTFVLAFGHSSRGRWPAADRFLPLVTLLLVLFLVLQVNGPLQVVLPVHLAVFFLAALVCHRELADDRPAPAHLTQFYLLVAFGGVLGSVFNTLVAPALFTAIVEYPAALVLVFYVRNLRDPQNGPARWWRWIGPLAVGVATAGILLATIGVESLPLRFALMGIPALLCLSLGRTRIPYATALAAILAVSSFQRDQFGETLFSDRTFFGTYRVRLDPTGEYHTLYHGTTLHGIQSISSARRQEALSYYHRSGPLGDVFTLAGAEASNVGVVGLGVGSIATYRREGQVLTFFEIDPAVEAIARRSDYFTYLPDCAAACRVVIGDARQALSTNTDQFGVLVLDAFSSDAIPVHLLTREAVDVYLSRLAPHGVLAFHISNRHLDLEPVLATVARELQLHAFIRRDQVIEDGDSGRRSSDWLIMSKTIADLGRLPSDGGWQNAQASSGARLWTDDFSNVLALLLRR
jgi:spermidine synthase